MRFARAAAMNDRESMDHERFKRDEATVLRDFWGKFQGLPRRSRSPRTC